MGAIIECKTQLSWNRDKWEDNFKNREGKLKAKFPKAKAFLVVLTSKGWGGFPDDSTLPYRLSGQKIFPWTKLIL